jgi:hypothetical protein
MHGRDQDAFLDSSLFHRQKESHSRHMPKRRWQEAIFEHHGLGTRTKRPFRVFLKLAPSNDADEEIPLRKLIPSRHQL